MLMARASPMTLHSKLPLAKLAPHVGAVLSLHCSISDPKAAEDGLSSWAPATHRGDPNEALGSWL